MNYIRENKKMFFLVIGIVVLISSVIVFLVLDKEGLKTINSTSYTTEFIMKEDNKVYEVKMEQTSNNTWLYVDGEQDELLSIIPRTPIPALQLPSTVTDIEPFDITLSEPLSELTWASTLEESRAYLTFLEQEGFQPFREVQTTDFIELILQKEEDRKRIIIFERSIMIGDLNKDAELTSLENYIKKYRTLGGKEDVK